jgi:hypothetical protein
MRDVLRRGGSNLDVTLLSTIYAEDTTTSSIAEAIAATSQNRDARARLLLPRHRAGAHRQRPTRPGYPTTPDEVRRLAAVAPQEMAGLAGRACRPRSSPE